VIWHLHSNGRSHAFENDKSRISVCGCVRITHEPVDAAPVYPCATCARRTKGREEKRMKIKVEIDCDNAALHDDLEGELTRILNTVPGKICKQLERDGRCICEAKESSDKLMDANGNTVGYVRLEV
jgi:hypothetical protein